MQLQGEVVRLRHVTDGDAHANGVGMVDAGTQGTEKYHDITFRIRLTQTYLRLERVFIYCRIFVRWVGPWALPISSSSFS